jgi:hypothetical protein
MHDFRCPFYRSLSTSCKKVASLSSLPLLCGGDQTGEQAVIYQQLAIALSPTNPSVIPALIRRAGKSSSAAAEKFFGSRSQLCEDNRMVEGV